MPKTIEKQPASRHHTGGAKPTRDNGVKAPRSFDSGVGFKPKLACLRSAGEGSMLESVASGYRQPAQEIRPLNGPDVWSMEGPFDRSEVFGYSGTHRYEATQLGGRYLCDCSETQEEERYHR